MRLFGALIRAAEGWRFVKVTEFECRQMAAVRKELDEEYEAAVPSSITDDPQQTACRFEPLSIHYFSGFFVPAAHAVQWGPNADLGPGGCRGEIRLGRPGRGVLPHCRIEL